MSGKRRNRPLIAGVEKSLEQLKMNVMKQKGYSVNPKKPDDVKYEVAKELGVALKEGHNGDLTSETAGKIGGQIGGAMVQELIRMAQNRLSESDKNR